MDGIVDTAGRTFVEVAEVWVPEDGRLVLSSGAYGPHQDFGFASVNTQFAKGEGLPGRAWAEARPILLTDLDDPGFVRGRTAKAAGLSVGVALPIFAGAELKAVMVLFCGGVGTFGAIEVWAEDKGELALSGGFYGDAAAFEDVSRATRFKRGHGLPGGVWASMTPILMRDLGRAGGFVRADAAA